jgi:uncharacterized protein
MRTIVPVLACILPLSAAVPNAIQDQFTPALYEQTRVSGLLGERLKTNLEGRLLHVDEKGLLAGFQHRPGEQDWIGEHIGKYLHAGCNTWRNTHDERLKAQMDRMVHALIATQMPDGYLGTYLNSNRWTSWDVWVHKYDLIGLLAYYDTFGYQPALDSARKVGDLLARTFGDSPGQRDIILSSTHMGMAATSVLEPMVDLYRHTGDPKHLAFCRYIVRAWEQPNGPKLVSSLTSSGSVYKTANAKAYEMMSDLVGALELYRLTGDRALLEAASRAWGDIHARRLYITGTASSHEHFQDDLLLRGEDSDDVGEGCATVTWLQLTSQLLRLTGDVRYAEQIERTVYNQLLGAQDPRNGDICYFTPLNGRKHATPGINCCVSSEPRGISMIPSLAGGQRGNGLAVVLYTPGRIATPIASVAAATDYPISGMVNLTIHPQRAGGFPLYLRVPEWTSEYTATAGGEAYKGTPGQWLTIERPWKEGDTVAIRMDMTVHVVPGRPTYNQSVAVQRGPQVLALEESLNPGVPSVDTAGPASADAVLRDISKQLPVEWTGRQAYAIDGAHGRPLVLVPFAEARSYRVWLMKPPAL